MNKRRKRTLLYLLGGILAGFIFLTIVVSMFPVSFIDVEFSEEIQEHQYPVLDILMKSISWPGYTPQSIVMVVLSSLTFFLGNLKREAAFILCTLLSGLVSHSLKILINRPRPTADLVRIIEVARHQSFPSGHVLFYVIFFGFLIVIINHLKIFTTRVSRVIIGFCALMIFTIPFSRVYLGAHWFTDVLASVFLGSIVLFILSYFYLNNSRPHQ